MQLIEIDTTFGTVAASEERLVEAVRALLLAEETRTEDDLLEAVSW